VLQESNKYSLNFSASLRGQPKARRTCSGDKCPRVCGRRADLHVRGSAGWKQPRSYRTGWGYAQADPCFSGVTSKRTSSGTANRQAAAAQVCWRWQAQAASLLWAPSHAGAEQRGASSGLSLQANLASQAAASEAETWGSAGEIQAQPLV